MEYSEAFARVEHEEEYIVDILQKIIAVDTSVPPGENYAKLIDIVEPEFKKYGFETERVVVPEEKVALIPYELSGERGRFEEWQTQGLSLCAYGCRARR
jgi:succinyl-diaminopimelate desuccinylase